MYILLVFLLIPCSIFANQHLHQECPIGCHCSGMSVNCSGMGFMKLPMNIASTTTHLIFSNNLLVSMKKSDFEMLPNLQHLDLQNNTIRYVEENILDAIPSLKYFDISKNKIKILPHLTSAPTKLSNLNLGFNMISKLDQDLLKPFPYLLQFNLAKNRVQSLPNNFFPKSMASVLKSVNLAGNPWSCDCRMDHLKRFGDATSANFMLAKCFFPTRLRGQLVSDLSSSELRCEVPRIEKEMLSDVNARVLKCPITSDESFHLNYIWMDGNEEIIRFNNSYWTTEDGDLTIPEKEGDHIRCTVDRLRFTKANHGLKKTASVSNHPEFTFQQQDTSSRDGEAVELVCEATGNPSPTIMWTFGNKEILESRKHKLMRAGRTLRIYPFLEADIGKYTCTAENLHGSISHTINVALLASQQPMIFDPPMNTKAEIGQMITLRCNARGIPQPDIYWLFEGTRIPRRNTRYSISENNVELTIEKVTRHDSGVFTCQAVNSIGSAVAQAELMVGTDLTMKVDDLLNPMTIDDIAMKARTKVESALTSTKESRRMDKINSPQDLKKLFKFAIPLKKVDLGKAREIYEESIRLVQMHIHNGLQFTPAMISPNVSYEAVLPAAYVQTLMEKSGCQTGQFVESCDDHCFFSKYRSYDGQCNNYEHSMWGVSEMAFLRLLPPRYENGFNTPVGWEKGKLYHGFKLPNPRRISRELIGTDEITPHNHLTAMTMQWGQFIDHDLTLTAPALTRHSYREGAFCNRTCENVDPCFNIQLEADDPKLHVGLHQKFPCIEFERNGAACGSGETSPIFQRVTYRDQLNLLTSFLDASGIYGNSEEQALELRDLYSDHGLLRFDIVSAANKPYMPFEKESDMDCRRNYSRENPINCFLAGDVRANEQLGLMSMHTVFLREHNRIASRLLEINEHWDGETIFQETRKLIGAMLQHVTYNDWLPKILGKSTFNEIIGEYRGYNPDTNPTIANEFATAALRFAHTLINPQLFRFDKNFKEIKEGHLPLHNAFFAPERLVSEGGVDPLLRGLFAAPIKLPRPDQILNKELTEKLFNRYHEVALDLAAMNIQRGRDHGLPTWTEYRKFCNLSVPTEWDDLKQIVHNDTVISKLKILYGVPQNIDLWVGGVTERRTSEALMGPTLACIIADQFRRLRDGDRFWYENEEMFSKAQLRQIKKVTLAKIICTNGDDIDRIQRDIFIYHGNSTEFYEKCEELPEMNLNMWTACCDSTCSSGGMSMKTSEMEDNEEKDGMRKHRRKRRSHRKSKKHCIEDGVKYRNGERWTHQNDKCVECMCENGETWCKTNCKENQ
ncbi:unnamed protein product [Caenorhabditis angaria]|uniref:Ig-like domain-containing protein n=1 Tax=Caenorhabditis angaria TaxID=860376 RepID=A0A9P1J4H3_9PELO|nr:unnamed protein product [Caenorhabditis angaria]